MPTNRTPTPTADVAGPPEPAGVPSAGGPPAGMLARSLRLALLGLGVLAGCRGPSALLPAGPGAQSIASLTWLLLAVLTAVYLAVIGALIIAARRRRPARAEDDRPRSDRRAVAAVIAAGAVAPALVLVVFFVATLRTLADVLPAPSPDVLTVEVTAHQWWWEFDYGGDPPLRTANELHIPVGRRVILRLHARDVIHSLWVPALHGKLDLIPGTTNVTWLQADRPGVYRGQCAEYCGVQHAQMALSVVAEPSGQFAAWMQAQRRPAAPPVDERAQRGARLFLDRGCAFCHTVRGNPLAFFGRVGPDLTHVASRRTLAAGVLRNSKGALAGWIANPQALKPGNRMPRIDLPPDEFHAILAYVDGLR